MAGFPNTPYVGQTYTVGAITWEWNGTAWTVKSSTTASIALTDLSDVEIVSPSPDEILKYNGSLWTNQGNLDGGSF